MVRDGGSVQYTATAIGPCQTYSQWVKLLLTLDKIHLREMVKDRWKISIFQLQRPQKQHTSIHHKTNPNQQQLYDSAIQQRQTRPP